MYSIYRTMKNMKITTTITTNFHLASFIDVRIIIIISYSIESFCAIFNHIYTMNYTIETEIQEFQYNNMYRNWLKFR